MPEKADEVDEIIAAWQRELPSFDPSPMHIWSRITRLAQLLDKQRAQAYQQSGLQVWEFDVLAALRRAGSPYCLTAGQLVEATHVTSGTMTNRIDRLSSRRLVTRTSRSDDKRGVLVNLTPAGASSVDKAIAALSRVEKELVKVLTLKEEKNLSDYLRRLLLAQEEWS